jgi:hypothetical protein
MHAFYLLIFYYYLYLQSVNIDVTYMVIPRNIGHRGIQNRAERFRKPSVLFLNDICIMLWLSPCNS